MKMLKMDFSLVCVRWKDVTRKENKFIQRNENKGSCYIFGVLGSTVVSISIGQMCTLGLLLF